MFKRHRFLSALATFSILLAISWGFAFATGPAGQTSAAPAPEGATHRVVMQDGGERRVVYLAQAAITATGTGSTICGLGAYDLHSAQVVLVGTPAGTNPTFAFTWQHSIDGGTTWHTVDTFTQVNATVTPAAQLKTVSDVKASTATAYGDCFRIQYTVGGTTPSATFVVVGYSQD